MMRSFLKGATRYVFLTRRYVIKIPYLGIYKNFLNGLLANMQEVQFWKSFRSPKLCPVVFSLPFGLLLVMPRCRALSNTEWNEFDYNQFIDSETFKMPVEEKKDSFGILNEKIVAVDYGT